MLATVVHLLENTLIRVGNDDYVKQNKSYGLTTLRDPHVKVEGAELRFQFKGKSGKTWNLQVKDRRIAQIVKACQDLPGQDLFQYLDEDGEQRTITSADVNAYLREITGREITAKDFRTWAGTVLAALALSRVRGLRQPGQGQEEHPRGHREGRLAPRQHADASAANATCTRRSSRATSTAACSWTSRSRSRRSCGRICPSSSPRRRPS